MKFDAGRVIAYVGGSGVSAMSQTSKASAAAVMDISPSPGEVVSLLNAPWFEMGGVHVVTADVVSVCGLVFVAVRLAFDIWKHFDNRRRERNG